MKQIDKDNYEPRATQKTDSPDTVAKSRSWQKVFGAVILCAVLALVALVIWGAVTGRITNKKSPSAVFANWAAATFTAVESSESLPDDLQEHLELYGESPSKMTLQRFGVPEVYSADGEKITIDDTMSISPKAELYADESRELQYVYYDGRIYTVNDGTICGYLTRPASTGGIEVSTCSSSHYGYLVENQHYSFERTSERQACALLHFVNEKTGETIMEDFMVFFEAGDLIVIAYPEIDGLEALSPGCWAWNAFELTVKYYEPEDVYKRAPSATAVGEDNVCVDVQPDGYPVVDPTTAYVVNDDGSVSEVVSVQTFSGTYKNGEEPQ